LDDIHAHSLTTLKAELESLFQRTITSREMDKLYPHHIGHYLGMDVHDSEGISRSRKLKRGMVVTIEPGVYVPATESYPAEFRGQGIRIEDDVLVGKDASFAFSRDVLKEVEEIETWMTRKFEERTMKGVHEAQV
jgi:intermediate cleaving peptidase 55